MDFQTICPLKQSLPFDVHWGRKDGMRSERKHLAKMASSRREPGHENTARSRPEIICWLFLAVLLISSGAWGQTANDKSESRKTSVEPGEKSSAPSESGDGLDSALKPDVPADARAALARFWEKDYAGAAAGLGAALAQTPDDHRLRFNYACALAARGSLAEAADQYRQVAAKASYQIAVAARYNLARVLVDLARAEWGEAAESASGDARAHGRDRLDEALKWLRECLELDPTHTDAQHNLEVLAAWKHQLENAWKNLDAQQQRAKEDAAAMLARVRQQQDHLAGKVREQLAAPPNARRRQQLRRLGNDQRALSEEMEPLKEKIAQAFVPPPEPPGEANVPPPHTLDPARDPARDQVRAALEKMVDEAAQAISSAGQLLRAGEFDGALQKQLAARDQLDALEVTLIDFPTLLQKLISLQKAVRETAAANDRAARTARQALVGRGSEVLGIKAQQGLQQATATPLAPPPTPEKKAESRTSEPPDFTRAYKKAVELTPRIANLARQAVPLLQANEDSTARPKQDEALRLLEEIAREMPQPPPESSSQYEPRNSSSGQDNPSPSQDQNSPPQKKQAPDKTPPPNPSDQDQQPDKQKQKQPDEDNDQKQKEQQEQERQERREQEKREKEQQEKEKKQQPGGEEKKPEPREPEKKAPPGTEAKVRPLSPAELEGLLQKARERQRRYRELKAVLERNLFPPEKTAKDW